MCMRCAPLWRVAACSPSPLPAGVSAVLASCCKLRALRLQHCAGVLDGGALLAAAESGGYR